MESSSIGADLSNTFRLTNLLLPKIAMYLPGPPQHCQPQTQLVTEFENLSSMDSSYEDFSIAEGWLQLSTTNEFLEIFKFMSTFNCLLIGNIEHHFLIVHISSNSWVSSFPKRHLSHSDSKKRKMGKVRMDQPILTLNFAWNNPNIIISINTIPLIFLLARNYFSCCKFEVTLTKITIQCEHLLFMCCICTKPICGTLGFWVKFLKMLMIFFINFFRGQIETNFVKFHFPKKTMHLCHFKPYSHTSNNLVKKNYGKNLTIVFESFESAGKNSIDRNSLLCNQEKKTFRKPDQRCDIQWVAEPKRGDFVSNPSNSSIITIGAVKSMSLEISSTREECPRQNKQENNQKEATFLITHFPRKRLCGPFESFKSVNCFPPRSRCLKINFNGSISNNYGIILFRNCEIHQRTLCRFLALKNIRDDPSFKPVEELISKVKEWRSNWGLGEPMSLIYW
ncbi:hypothetical protein VP01_2810g3 [Puccinia sorghi]|uniref:Uncharacterized protein n=1 Tax=Puccinia sorghi TaxID=27349 RepID=A0A0L6V361_9BASI|nr:hypothetical protein VP01_2810g3 [Puccinia sorghi]